MSSFSFSILIALFSFTAILRLFELIKANRNYRNRIAEEGLQYPKENYFFLFIVLHLSFLILTPLEVYFFQREFIFLLGIAMFFIYILCLFLRFHILKVLGKNWNTKVIVNPENEASIVTDGIYNYIRHPNYLIVILEIFSLSLFHSAYISFIIFSILNIIILFFRIRFEENLLFMNIKYKEHFYRKKRFIPGIF